MLLIVWQALNPLSIHVTFTAIVPGAYPGEAKMCPGWLQKLTHVPLAIASFLYMIGKNSLCEKWQAIHVDTELYMNQLPLIGLCEVTLSTAQPAYLHNVTSVLSPGRTRSSSLITITRPPSSSSLTITNRSFRYASPSLWWNNLPASFRQPQAHSPSETNITPSITSSLFHSRLKTHLFHKSFPP